MANIWDVLGKAGEGAVKAAVANQNAQNTLKSQVMLYKIKHQFEQEAKTGERKDKFAMDLALEKEKVGMQYQAFDEWRGRNPGGAPGAVPRVEMGPDAKMKVLKLKDMAERIYMKAPNTWSPQEKQIVEQYKAFTMATRAPQGGGYVPMFGENGSQPEPTTLPEGITEEDLAHTMKLHNLTREEVLSRIQ